MAKMPKYPKAPKAGASMATLQKYEKKAAEVAKKRAAILADKKKRTGIREKVTKLKEKY